MRAAVFLDRDGVINVERDHVYLVSDFVFVDGIFGFCRAAQAAGFLLVVVTNQAGIGRGYYTEADFERLTTWMLAAFAAEHVDVSAVYFCPFHPTEGVGAYQRDSPARKPNPGMLLKARADLDLDLAASILVGDRWSDIEAGRRAGVGRLCLLENAQGRGAQATTPDVLVCASLREAAHALFGHGAP